MKSYNHPVTQVVACEACYMLMQNVSGGGLNGIHEGNVGSEIEIN